MTTDLNPLKASELTPGHTVWLHKAGRPLPGLSVTVEVVDLQFVLFRSTQDKRILFCAFRAGPLLDSLTDDANSILQAYQQPSQQPIQ